MSWCAVYAGGCPCGQCMEGGCSGGQCMQGDVLVGSVCRVDVLAKLKTHILFEIMPSTQNDTQLLGVVVHLISSTLKK